MIRPRVVSRILHISKSRHIRLLRSVPVILRFNPLFDFVFRDPATRGGNLIETPQRLHRAYPGFPLELIELQIGKSQNLGDETESKPAAEARPFLSAYQNRALL